LGCLNDTDDDIYRLIELLMIRYRVDKIYVHIDPLTKDIWLNLDANLKLGGRLYPGAPYLSGSGHYLITDLSVGVRDGVAIADISLQAIVNDALNSPGVMTNLSKIKSSQNWFISLIPH
jgi:hypothetical protein